MCEAAAAAGWWLSYKNIKNASHFLHFTSFPIRNDGHRSSLGTSRKKRMQSTGLFAICNEKLHKSSDFPSNSSSSAHSEPFKFKFSAPHAPLSTRRYIFIRFNNSSFSLLHLIVRQKCLGCSPGFFIPQPAIIIIFVAVVRRFSSPSSCASLLFNSHSARCSLSPLARSMYFKNG